MKTRNKLGIALSVGLAFAVNGCSNTKPAITLDNSKEWVHCWYEEDYKMAIHAFDSDGIDRVEVYNESEGGGLKQYDSEKEFQAIFLIRHRITKDGIYNVRLTDLNGDFIDKKYERKGKSLKPYSNMPASLR